MLRRFTTSIIQSRSISTKNKINIKWVRPPYVPAYKAEKSGDLEGLPPIPDTAFGRDFAMSEEIKDAPEAVKKLFSVAFLGQKELNILVKKELTERVKRHKYDETTAETKIAGYTAHIRYLQDIMEKYPKNSRLKVVVQELIARRKKLLKFLRQYDYKKFEWLLEKLNIEYKGHPESYHKLTRKESLRKLTEMHCDDIRSTKLADYRNLLESQQGPFLKQKVEDLKLIRSEQMELKLPVTVAEQDIKKVEKQLQEWAVKDQNKQQAKRKRVNILFDVE